MPKTQLNCCQIDPLGIGWSTQRSHYVLASLYKILSYQVIKSKADVTQSLVGGGRSKFGHHGGLQLSCGFMQSITCHNIKSGFAIISHTN